MYGFFVLGGVPGRGGRLTIVVAPAVFAVPVEVVEDDDDAEVLVVPGVIGVVLGCVLCSGMTLRLHPPGMTLWLHPPACSGMTLWLLPPVLIVVDGAFSAFCVLLISASIALSGNASSRCKSA